MKKLILPFLIVSSLAGCSSTPGLDKTTQYTGGETMGDATSFYWATETIENPLSSSDYVNDGKSGWYKTYYKWNDGKVQELIRKGETLTDKQGMVPFSVVIRFNPSGEAIYQQYRLGGHILPLNETQLVRYLQEAQTVTAVVNQQKAQGTVLIQGLWTGKEFKSCDGKVYDKIEFNKSLPKFVVSRLSSVESYVAFLGKVSGKSVEVDKLLMMADKNQQCIARPSYIKE